MNLLFESTQSTNEPQLVFNWADYVFSTAYQWHVRQSGSNELATLPDQIQLQAPLQPDKFNRQQIAAQARTPERNCIWWVRWEPSPLKKVYYAIQQHPEGVNMLIFVKLELGFRAPFRLILLDIEQLPRSSKQYWPLIGSLLKQLPDLTPEKGKRYCK